MKKRQWRHTGCNAHLHVSVSFVSSAVLPIRSVAPAFSNRATTTLHPPAEATKESRAAEPQPPAAAESVTSATQLEASTVEQLHRSGDSETARGKPQGHA